MTNRSLYYRNLYYESSSDPVFTPRWGGDIASEEWRVGTQGTVPSHKYSFLYDQFSRLTQANHSSTDTTFRFTRHYSYNREGNLLSLYKEQRSSVGTAVQITNKTFTYEGHRFANPESLAVIDDPIFPEPGLVEPEPIEPEPIILDPEPVIEPGLTLDEYLYDSVGNLTAAFPENISNISYNILNLPQHVDVSQGLLAGLTVDINYSSTGEKLSRQVEDANFLPGPPRIYLGALILENNAPYMLLVDGGYVSFQLVNNQYQGTYHFYVNDHQDNIRAIVDENGSIEKEYHYDPYGEVVYESTGSSENQYKYSGKEWDSPQKAYDFGARMHMPSHARFTTMDRSCEKYYSISPYAYCADNPVNLVDPDGKDIGVLSLEGQHMALLIEQEDNKWAYYSINGDNVYSSGSHIGGRPYNDLGEKVFESPEAFLSSEFNRDDGNDGKENRDIANYNYTSVYVISTDDNHEQDTIIADEIKRINSEESYSLFKPNHCATAVQRSLLKAGIETRAPYVVTSPVGGVVSHGMAFPYTPHSAYNQIKFNNSGREIKK